MIDYMPRNLISKKDVHNWDLYSPNLANLKYVSKYLGNTLKKWVENEKISNPLAILWVRLLFGNQPGLAIEKDLEDIEKLVKENDIRMTFDELYNEGGKADQINRKIESTIGELLVLDNLITRFKDIRRIHQGGDWERNNTIVSVKSILDLDFNYEVIENTLRGIFYFKENEAVLHNFSKIRLSDQKNIDDEFRDKVISFVEDKLTGVISYFYPGWLSGRSCSENFQATGLDINVSIPRNRDIVILLKEERTDELHQIKIAFNKRKINGILYIHYDTWNWWSSPAPDTKLFERDIPDKLKKLDKEASAAHKENKIFEGWIDISVHPQHREYIRENEKEIQKKLEDIVDSRNYKVIFVFRSRVKFEADKDIIIQF